MSNTPLGRIKASAKRIGISLEEFCALKDGGQKFCWKCKTWKPLNQFSIDNSRHDQKKTSCIECCRVKIKKSPPGRAAGFTVSQETRNKMRAIFTGRPNLKRRGIKHTAEAKKKISEAVRLGAVRGKAHHAYKDGRKQERANIRQSPEYRQWRYDVFTRDGYTCQHCGDDSGGNLNAHHVKPFSTHPELRLDVTNGITLCWDCHDIEHATRTIKKRRRNGKRPAYAAAA